MTGQRDTVRLAVDGGPPVRDVRAKPWPTWPRNTPEQWERAVGPALRNAYLAGTEGPGDLTESFEREFAGYCGVERAVMTPSGTTAIAAGVAGALDLDGIEDGGEILVPDYTYTATALAALNVGCSVAFVDIHPESFTMDPGALEAAVSGRTVAVLPVHLAGHPADMTSINDVARRHGLRVIEDCAQAAGAQHQSGKVGSLGNAGAFSFQSTKNLTSGEGGAVVTNDLARIHRRTRMDGVRTAEGGG